MIPIASPYLDEEDRRAVSRPLETGWVTQGPEVEAFEREFAAVVGAAHACAVSSCTTALHLALRAVGVGPGDEVITVSHSFIASANAIRYLDAIPVFADIDPATFNLDPSEVAPLVSPRTRAILCVHQIGMPCDLGAILEIAAEHGLPVVEDAACAVGSRIRLGAEWESIGKPHGDVACFSFHPRKLLTTGDGGMLTSATAELDAKFRLWRQHSMSIPDTVRHEAETIRFEEYTELGYNYRMTDIQAALGRTQLAKLEAIVERRREQADRYRRLLDGLPGVVCPTEPEWARSNWQSYCVRLPAGIDQRALMQDMREQGVATRRGIMCAHMEPAYSEEPWRCRGDSGVRKGASDSCEELRHSEAARDRCVLLPLFHELTKRQQEQVVEALARACET